MSKVRDLPETTSLDDNDLLYAVDESAGPNGGRKITKENLKASVAPTAEETKEAYESNPDTNAFTDAEKAKLATVETGAAFQNASEVPYDNTESGLAALELQAAINELQTEKEPVFAKNTGFNKNFGVTSGTVAEGNDTRFSTQNVRKVKKNPGDSEFSSIAAAVASIVAPAHNNRWSIDIGPGIFIEPLIVLPPFVTLKGDGIHATIIQPDTTTHDIVQADDATEISSLRLIGTGIGYSAISYLNKIGTAVLDDLMFTNNDTAVSIKSTVASGGFAVQTYSIRYSGNDGTNFTSIKVESTAGSLVSCRSYDTDVVAGPAHFGANIVVRGLGAYLLLDGIAVRGNTASDTGILVTNGGNLDLASGHLYDLAIGIHADNIGLGPTAQITGCSFIQNTTNLKIENVNATGSFNGHTEYSKQIINLASEFFITNKDARILTVAKKGGDFTSVKAALDSITDASASNRYSIQIGPGIFTEDTINMKPYVDITGVSRDNTIIQPDASGKHLINATTNSGLYHLSLTGVSGAGYALVYLQGDVTFDNNDVSQINNVNFGASDTLVKAEGTAGYANILVQDCLYGSLPFNTGFHAFTNLNVETRIIVKDSTSSPGMPACVDFMLAHGEGAAIVSSSCLTRSASMGGNALRAYDGGRLRVVSGSFRGFNNGVVAENTGVAPRFEMSGIVLGENNTDILIDHPGTIGMISGSAQKSKTIVPAGTSMTIAIFDPVDPGILMNGKFNYGEQDASNASDIAPLIVNGATMGVIDGGVLGLAGGLDISVSAGFGYLISSDFPTHQVKRLDWNLQFFTMPANAARYVYFDATNTLVASSSLPIDTATVIVLGRVTTDASNVLYIEKIPVQTNHYGNKIDKLFREALGPVYSSGSIVTEIGTRQLEVTSGRYYFSEALFTPAGGSPISWDSYYRSATPGLYTKIVESSVSNSLYDDGSGTLMPIPAGQYAKHAMWIIGGPSEKYILVYAQAVHPSAAAAETAPLPLPPGFISDSFARLVSVVVQEGVSSISAIYDERPRLGFNASGVSSTSSHSSLSDLSNDDHLQYLRTDGGRTVTGNINMGGNQIINVGLVDGTDISQHALRHLPNGADPEPTAAPLINIGATTANGVGTANSFARSDHQHGIAVGVTPQTLTPDLANAEGTSNSLARADHIHNVPAAIAVGLTANSVNAEGTSNSFSRADHVHFVLTGTPSTQTPDQANDVGVSPSLARADHQHNIPTDAPMTPLSPAITDAEGTGSSFSRNDHTHSIATALVADIVAIVPDTAASAGVANNYARGDHTHAITASAPTTILSPATANAEGAATSFSRGDHTHSIATGLVGEITTILPDDAAAAGALDKFARADHKHAIATAAPTTTLTPVTTNAEGVGTSFSRNDHTHAIATGLVADITSIDPDDAASAGVLDRFARADHQHAIVADAPTVTLSPVTTNAEGVATSFSRADHQHAIATGLVADITTILPNDASSAGTANNYARGDHRHAIAAATAVSATTSSTNAEGASTSFSRADHVHAVTVTTFEATATADDTENSTGADVLMGSMTLTPGAGTYLAMFSGSLTNTNNGSERTFVSLYANGVQVTATERSVGSQGIYIPTATQAVITVAGGQAIEIRWRVAGGTSTVRNRRLTLLKVA